MSHSKVEALFQKVEALPIDELTDLDLLLIATLFKNTSSEAADELRKREAERKIAFSESDDLMGFVDKEEAKRADALAPELLEYLNTASPHPVNFDVPNVFLKEEASVDLDEDLPVGKKEEQADESDKEESMMTRHMNAANESNNTPDSTISRGWNIYD